jgi:hypothetical protein
MTQAEYDSLPRGEDIPKGHLKYVPFGFRFKMTSDATIIGEVVKGLDAFADQVGACMTPPDRFVNSYRAKIIN